jgi:transposase InsO family protein
MSFEILDKAYVDSGYAGLKGVYALVKDKGITQKQVLDYLKNIDTKHKNQTQSVQRSIPDYINQTWGINLIDMTNYKKQNSNYGWILTVIDHFSKYAYAVALKNKSDSEVYQALTSILDHDQPDIIISDRGNEFTNHKIEKYLQDHGIEHHLIEAYSPQTNGLIERFNRTLKQKLFKHFERVDSHKWIDVLDQMTKAYNNTEHSATGYAPNAVTESTAGKVEHNLLKSIHNDKITNNKVYEIGDLVRIPVKKSAFEKKLVNNYSDDEYRVEMRFPGVMGFIKDTYAVRNVNGMRVKKKFRFDQLKPAGRSQPKAVKVAVERKEAKVAKKVGKELNIIKSDLVEPKLYSKRSKAPSKRLIATII